MSNVDSLSDDTTPADDKDEHLDGEYGNKDVSDAFLPMSDESDGGAEPLKKKQKRKKAKPPTPQTAENESSPEDAGYENFGPDGDGYKEDQVMDIVRSFDVEGKEDLNNEDACEEPTNVVRTPEVNKSYICSPLSTQHICLNIGLI